MISLLLTLFISLFSYCPSIYKLEDHEENNYITYVDEYVNKRSMDYITDRGYVNRYYFTNEIINSDNFHNYYNVNPSYFTSPRLNSVLNYRLTDTAYYYNQISNVDFFTEDYPYGSSYIAFDTIEFTMDAVYTQSGNATIEHILVNLYYVKGSNQGVVKSIGGFYVYPYYISGSANPQGCCLTYDTNFSNTFAACVSIRTRDRTINEFYDLFRSDYAGYELGYENGYATGESNGYQTGYQVGYNNALTDFQAVDSTAFTIFSGILDVGLLPVNVFLAILNFDVFGINISGFVSALLTVSIVIIIVRFLFGGKSDGK